MKKALVLAVFACWAAQLTAQSAKGKFSIKPMMGINVTDFSGSLVGDIYHPKVRFAAGAEMEYGITDWLGLTLGAVYSQQGASIDGTPPVRPLSLQALAGAVCICWPLWAR